MTHPLALITGASSGIGYHLAEQFARHGYDLCIAAEDEGIYEAAANLSIDGARVHPVEVDLRRPKGVKQLYRTVSESGHPLAAAALNAGVGHGGRFVDTDPTDDLEIVDLNVRSTTHLAKLVLRDMARRNEGRVLFTSSMPGSHQAVYNASKSFIQSLAEALADELRDTEVVVTSLMPGPADTGQPPFKDDPVDVARQGYDALMAGKGKVVAESLHTKALGAVNKVLPVPVKTGFSRLLSKPTHR